MHPLHPGIVEASSEDMFLRFSSTRTRYARKRHGFSSPFGRRTFRGCQSTRRGPAQCSHPVDISVKPWNHSPPLYRRKRIFLLMSQSARSPYFLMMYSKYVSSSNTASFGNFRLVSSSGICNKDCSSTRLTVSFSFVKSSFSSSYPSLSHVSAIDL